MTPEEQQPEQTKESIFAALWNEVKDAPNFTIALQEKAMEVLVVPTFMQSQYMPRAAAVFAEFCEYCIFEILASGETTPRNSAMLETLKARRDYNRARILERTENDANNKRTKENREFWADLVCKTKNAVFDFVLHDVMQRPVRYVNGVIAHGELPFGYFDGQILTLRNTEHKTVVKSLFILATDGHPFFKPFSQPGKQWNTSALFTALETTGKLRYADKQIESLRTVLNDNFSRTSLSRTQEIPELTEILHRILSA